MQRIQSVDCLPRYLLHLCKVLQRCLGSAARVVRAVRPVLYRLINLFNTKGGSSPHLSLSSREAKFNLAQTLLHAVQWCAIYGVVKQLADHAIAADASSSTAAAVHGGDYVFSDIAADIPELLEYPIHVKESYAVLLACRRWGHGQ